MRTISLRIEAGDRSATIVRAVADPPHVRELRLWVEQLCEKFGAPITDETTLTVTTIPQRMTSTGIDAISRGSSLPSRTVVLTSRTVVLTAAHPRGEAEAVAAVATAKVLPSLFAESDAWCERMNAIGEGRAACNAESAAGWSI